MCSPLGEDAVRKITIERDVDAYLEDQALDTVDVNAETIPHEAPECKLNVREELKKGKDVDDPQSE